MTVVTTPPSVVRTGTSPERASPGSRAPTMASVNPTYWDANAAATATGVS